MPEDFVFAPDEVHLPSGSLIGGVMVAGDGEPFEIVRPSDGRVLRTEHSASADVVDLAVQLARSSHRSGVWADAPAQQRSRVFRRWAELVETHAAELVERECTVSTRLATEVAARDIPVVAAMIRYYGELIDKIEGAIYSSPVDSWSLGFHEPYGVVAAISPWNVPMLLATAKIAPALAAGNAVVLKPSEFTPYAILRLAELAIEAGLPPGQLAVLSGVGPQTGHALVTHPEVDYVSFTGSTATGARLMADAALSGPRPVSLEMGGKTPQVVFADADLDAAAQFISNSVVRNAGQICYAGTRLVVDHTIADEMVDRITRLIAHVEPGPTWSKKTTLAPILSQRQLDRVVSILQQGTAQGAVAVAGGAVIETGKGGFFFQPTVLRSMHASNPVIRQEIFGPVLAVQPFSDMDEAISLADHCDYGLGASVYTRNLNTAMKCARAIKSGSVWINCFGVNDIIAPVGGYKKSGFGKDFGQDGMLKYMRSKSILVKSFS